MGPFAMHFAQRFISANEVSSRKVVVVREGLANTSDNLKVRSITLIQDATEEDPEQPEKSSEQLLLDDLLEVLTGTEGDIYLCCVNRGILSSAARIAEENDEYSDLLSFIKDTLYAVTNNADSPPCWPLDGYEEMAVWPMDVESLVEVQEAVVSCPSGF